MRNWLMEYEGRRTRFVGLLLWELEALERLIVRNTESADMKYALLVREKA